jgi:hypothetical protein
MSNLQPGHTVADVLHHMYLASDDGFTFPDTLCSLLKMEVHQLRTLYDQPAPDPRSPTFPADVRGIVSRVGCDPDALADLLRQWTPSGPSPVTRPASEKE